MINKTKKSIWTLKSLMGENQNIYHELFSVAYLNLTLKKKMIYPESNHVLYINELQKIMEDLKLDLVNKKTTFIFSHYYSQDFFKKIKPLSKNLTYDECKQILYNYFFIDNEGLNYNNRLKLEDNSFENLVINFIRYFQSKSQKPCTIYDAQALQGRFMLKSTTIKELKLVKGYISNNIDELFVSMRKDTLNDPSCFEYTFNKPSQNNKFDYLYHGIIDEYASLIKYNKTIKSTYLNKRFEIDTAVINNGYTELLKNLEYLKDTGIGFFILRAYTKPTTNVLKINKALIEQDKVLAMINLPKQLFKSKNYMYFLIILGDNPKQEVAFINANNLGYIDRELKNKKNLSKKDIDYIIDLYANENDKKQIIKVSKDKILAKQCLLNPLEYLNDIDETNSESILLKDISKIIYPILDNLNSYMIKYSIATLEANGLKGLKTTKDWHQMFDIHEDDLIFTFNHNHINILTLKSDTNINSLDNNTIIVRLDKKKCNVDYVKAFFNSQQGKDAIKYAILYNKKNFLSKDSVERIKIPKVDPNKEELIATLYNKMEAEIVKFQNSITHCQDIIDDIFPIK